jgi:hypothetical protein
MLQRPAPGFRSQSDVLGYAAVPADSRYENENELLKFAFLVLAS